MSVSKASIYYDIITEYNGKGTNTAAKSLGTLDGIGKKLAKTLATTFSVAAVEEFARKSVMAFAKEDAALKILAQTLGNVGLGFKTVEVSHFITALAESTGVMKDTLFPAFETLIRYTGDVGKAQDLLKLSLDVSAGTGKDTAAVALALGKAYGGNTVALGRLGAGLTKAELSSKNFALVQSRLAALFKGDAAAAADSFAGKLNILKVAFTEMQVQVGQGLVNALTALGGNDGISKATGYMDRFGQSINDALTGLAAVGTAISNLPGLKFLTTGVTGFVVKSLTHNLGFDLLQNIGKQKVINGLSNDTYTQQKRTLVAQNAITAATSKQVSTAKTALQLAKDKAALDKANAALKLADSVFDLSKIEIMAALARGQNQMDTDRLNLQLLILNATNLTGDAATKAADNATILAEKILMANGLVMLADGSIKNLSTAKNPFAGFDAYVQSVLNGILAVQLALNALKPPTFVVPTSGGGSAPFTPITAIGADKTNPSSGGYQTGANLPTSSYAGDTTNSNSGGYQTGGVNGSGLIVNVLLDPSTLTTTVTTGQQNSTLGGIQVGSTRINAVAIA
jgi:hypothetical protein